MLQRKKPVDHEIVDLDSDLSMAPNPLFASDINLEARAANRDLATAQAELDRIAKQNAELRRDLAVQKEFAQFSSSTSRTNGSFSFANPFMKKKEFKPSHTKTADQGEDFEFEHST